MRKLMWFSIGFCAACVLGVYLLPRSIAFLLGLLLLVMGVALLCLRRKDWVRISAVICIGIAIGLLWYRLYDATKLSSVRSVDGEIRTITIECNDFSFESDYGITADAVTEVAGKHCQVRFYLNQKLQLSPGDRVTGEFRLRYTAPGGKDDPTYHSGNGILLLAYPKGDHTIFPAQDRPVRYLPAYLRQYLLNLITDMFPTDGSAFAKALLLGDTSELSYETESDLTASGIRHVAAVSGLHVSILFSLVYLFSGKRRILTVFVGIPVLLIFAAMAGFSPSIVRASLMQLLMLLALLFKREYDPPTALAFAVLVMLTVNPLTVTSTGFQLSVASVAGIFLFCGRINSWLQDPRRLGKWKKNKQLTKLVNGFTSSVSISLSALIATTPLTAWYFGSVSLLSAVTNLLCLWVVTILFCGIIVACILGAMWMPLGKGMAWLLGWLIKYILSIAKIVASLPVSVVYTKSPYVVAWLVFVYILLFIFVFSKEKRPAILSCCAILSLCIVLLASWVEPLLDNYRVTLLDVGQGQCVLLQSKGKTYMVDCGGDYDEDVADSAAAMLLSQGITHLDGIILTHYDKDHVGAAAYLLYRVGADVLILPDGDEAQAWDPVLLKHHTGEVLRGDKELQIGWSDAEITVYPSWNTESSNESSLCVLFQTEKCAILITGDRSTVGEEVLVKTVTLPQLDALVVGHHGAASSTGTALLEATRPKTALISVGEDNAYKHPSEQVLDRLISYGCQIRRTDIEGTIIFRG